MKTCDPTELTALLRSGDLEALDRLTRCHGARLIAVGVRWCRSREDAEDAVQDALLAAGGHLRDFRGDGPVEGWLVRLVRNACHRQRRGRKNDPSLHVVDVEPVGADDPERLAAQGEVAVQVGRTLAALSPADRTLLLLVDGDGWTPAEVAAEVGLAPGAVRTRLSRARARVRDALATGTPA